MFVHDPRAVHPPSLQVVPVKQELPHFPQLFTSTCASTHIPLQYFFPPGQEQLPDWQVAPDLQTFPHVPQL